MNLTKVYRQIRFFITVMTYIFMRLCISFITIFGQKPNFVYCDNTKTNDTKEIVFIGMIDAQFLSSENNARNLSKIIGNNSLLFYYSNIEGKTNKNFFNVKDLDNSIVVSGGNNIGFSKFDFNKKNRIKDRTLKADIIKKHEILRKGKADISIACVFGDDKSVDRYKKIIGTWGFDLVIGFGFRNKGRRNFRAMNLRETRIIYSLGAWGIDKQIDENVETNIASFAYKIEIQKGRFNLIKEGYIPFLIRFKGERISNFREIIKEKYFKSDLDATNYMYIERKLRGLRNWRELIILKDIFNVLNINIPEKYSKFSSFSVNSICARTYELAPGNIFFFRKAFNDKNDLKREKEFLRNRLVIRAWLRRSLFIFSYKKLLSNIPHVVIENPMEAHIKVMRWYREKFISAKYIGVTGSTGKTSTKDMIYCVLKEQYRTGRSIRNNNVQVKIGINMQNIKSDCQLYVQEIGGGRPGGASRHSRMIGPEVSVITNIGTAHIGNYDSQEELMNNKFGIVEGMDNGTLFLNADDPLLVKAKPPCRTVYYSVKNKNADYFAENVREEKGRTYFDIVSKNDKVSAKINVLGEYNVLNAICAFAVAKFFGMNDVDIIKGLESFKTSGSRQNLIEIGGYHIFADCYNASISSIKNALDVLEKVELDKSGRRVAIIGDVTGMGSLQVDVNKKIAEMLDDCKIDKIVCFGNNSNEIRGYLKNNIDNTVCLFKAEDMKKWMKENIQKNDIVLAKGSSKVKLDELLDSVFGTDLADQRYIDEAHFTTFRKKNFKYRVFKNYVTLNKYFGEEEIVSIRKNVLGKPVKKISQGAFKSNEKIKSVEIGENVVRIGENAFKDCRNLTQISLNDNLRVIGEYAFENCINLKKIMLPKGLIHIGENAFRGCENLKILMPEGASYMDKNILDKCNRDFM